MLGTLRKHSRSVLIYVLFGVIIVVFVFTFNVASPDAGCGGSKGKASAALASVGENDLDLSTLFMGLALSADPPAPGSLGDPKAFQAELVYRSTRFARLRGDGQYSPYIPDPRAVSGIKARKVMDDLIETYLVSDEAIARGLRVGPDQVRDRIVQDFADQDGKFKKKSYEDWVRYGLRTSLARFEEFVRREILRQKMIGLVVANVSVSDREARHVAAQRKSKRTYEYLEVSPALLAEAVGQVPAGTPAAGLLAAAMPTPAEISAWLADKAADAKKFYEDHKAEYQQEATWDFHVLKVAAPSKRVLSGVKDDEQKKTMQAGRAEAKKKAEDLYKGIQVAGTSLVMAFESAARSSDDPATAARGGRVEKPLTDRQVLAMDPAILAALKKLQKGQASEVVEADDGFYLLLADGGTPAADRPFDEVKEQIARRVLAEQKAKTAVEPVASEVLKKALAAPAVDLTKVATELNATFAPASPVKWGDTGEIPGMPEGLAGMLDWSAAQVPGLGESEELAAALRALTPENPVAGKVFQVGGSDARYVVRLKAATAGEAPTADEIAAAAREFLPLKRQAIYREWYASIRAAAAAQGRLVEREALAALIRDEMRSHEEAAKRTQGAGKGKPNLKLPVPTEDGE